MSVPVILVARNSLALTKLAVRSVLAQDAPVDLFVVDNASSDGTGPWLRSKNFTFMFTDIQWSLARCWNTALRMLWSMGHQEAMLVNNDVVLRPDAVRLLTSIAVISGAGMVTGIGVDKEDLAPRTNPGLMETLRPFPDFSCLLIQKWVTDKVGWFDEELYPAFYEDNDYHVRMYRANVKAIACDVPFLHYSSGTLKNASPAEASMIQRGAERNRERFRAKYGCFPGTPEYQALFSR